MNKTCPEELSTRMEKTFIQECSDSDRDTEILSSDSPASESTAVPDLKRTESVFRQYLQTETSLSLRIKTGMQSNNENLVSHLQCPKRQYLQTETSLSLRIKTGMQSNNENPVSLHCPKRSPAAFGSDSLYCTLPSPVIGNKILGKLQSDDCVQLINHPCTHDPLGCEPLLLVSRCGVATTQPYLYQFVNTKQD
ncbi:hypothetical protein MHYP_G00122050 [Metynnis hypsauchen]